MIITFMSSNEQFKSSLSRHSTCMWYFIMPQGLHVAKQVRTFDKWKKPSTRSCASVAGRLGASICHDANMLSRERY